MCYPDPTVLFKLSFVCHLKKIILKAKYFYFFYAFFHKTKLSKSYHCREAVRNSYNCREAVRDSYICREVVRDSYNCREAVRDSYNCREAVRSILLLLTSLFVWIENQTNNCHLINGMNRGKFCYLFIIDNLSV